MFEGQINAIYLQSARIWRICLLVWSNVLFLLKKRLAYSERENIDFVPKASNPTIDQEVRPIEDIWTEIKRLVYDGTWKAKNLGQFRNRINYAFQNADIKLVHSLGNEWTQFVGMALKTSRVIKVLIW